jgi:hypothetical protein
MVYTVAALAFESLSVAEFIALTSLIVRTFPDLERLRDQGG